MKKNTLMEELDHQLEITGKALQQSPWSNPEFYAQWLAQTTFFVRHSTRLLSLSAGLCSQDYQAYHQRFIQHAQEEKGHENLTLLDLKSLHRRIEEFSELPSTQSFFQTQYYWIMQKNPLAFFGYILCLECLAVKQGPALTKAVTESHGPKSAHFLRVHSEDDVDHVKEAVKQVSEMPPDVQELIFQNLQQSFANYRNILAECRALSQHHRKAS